MVTQSHHNPVNETGPDLRRGDLARVTGCNLETIRYYEAVGLLPTPARSAAGHRLYGGGDVRRLRFILRARELGFSLADIRGLLGLGDGALQSCAEVRDRTATHLHEVQAKIADLQRIEAVLSQTMARCSGKLVPDCPILDSLRD
jgi:MerR family mercuric resistance operon transcriptional regulator